MNSKNWLKFAVVGMAAGLFLSAQSATTNKVETETTIPKKEAVAVEKKETAAQTDAALLKKEVAADEQNEVAMMKCSKEPATDATVAPKECKPKAAEPCKKCEKKACSADDSEKALNRKSAAKEAIEG